MLKEDPELFFRRRSEGDFTDDYGLNCTVENWPLVSFSFGYVVGLRTSRKGSLRRSTSSRLKRARSGTPRTPQGPLVPGEPRGLAMAMAVVRYSWCVVETSPCLWEAQVVVLVLVLFLLSRVTDV